MRLHVPPFVDCSIRPLMVVRESVPVALCILFLLLPVQPACGQRDSLENRPVIGLALSGGGAKGFAHIGVIEQLRDMNVPIDLITGTSMGCVIGSLYAIGYDTNALEEIATQLDWNTLFNDRPPRRFRDVERRFREIPYVLSLPLRGRTVDLPAAMIPGQQISMLLSRLTLPVHDVRNFRDLPIPVACVATDIETGEAVRLEEGVLPVAIRASMSLPGFFTPVRIGDRTLIDGAVTRNIPAEDARALGADIVICSDVSDSLLPADSLESMLDIFTQAVTFQMFTSNETQRSICDVYIRPDITDVSTFSFVQARDIIERGAQATQVHRKALLPYSQKELIPSDETKLDIASSLDTIYVTGIEITGARPEYEALARSVLNLDTPGHFSTSELERALYRIYGTRRFEYALYYLEADTSGTGSVLVINTRPGTVDRIGMAVRFESHYNAAILFDANIHDVLRVGSLVDVGLRLGTLLQSKFTYMLPINHRLRSLYRLDGARIPLDIFGNDARISTVRVDYIRGEARLGTTLFGELGLGTGIRAEIYRLDQSVGEQDFDERAHGLLVGLFSLYLDTFDQHHFPTSGNVLEERSEFSSGFSSHLFNWKTRVPFRNRLAGIGEVLFARSFGPDLPFHYRIFLGGDTSYGILQQQQFPLLGYGVNELSGRSVRMVRLGAQYQILPRTMATLNWNAARVENDWQWNPLEGGFRSGFGLTLGVLTRIGPIELTTMSSAIRGPYAVRVNLGYTF